MLEPEAIKIISQKASLTAARIRQRINEYSNDKSITRRAAIVLLAKEYQVKLPTEFINPVLGELRDVTASSKVIKETKVVFKNRTTALKLPNLVENVWADDKVVIKVKSNSEDYQLLCYTESIIRNLIEEEFTKIAGSDWFNSGKILISKKVAHHVEISSNAQERDRWVDQRNERKTAYMNFGDLVDLIENNQKIFIPRYFKDIYFAKSNLDEIEKLRNIIAHSNKLSKINKQLLYFNSTKIIKQINIKK